MKKAHYFSGILIAIFVGLHLINHLVSLAGIEAHQDLMDSLRIVYRNPVVEALLLLAIGFQIITGLRLFRKQRKLRPQGYAKLQGWTGLYLALFSIIHVSAVLAGRWLLRLPTDFYFAAAGLNTFPTALFFVPYYFLGVFSVFGHLAAVHAQKMKRSLFGLSAIQQANILVSVGVVVGLCILYGFTGGFQGIAVPTEYDVLVGK